MYIDVLLFDGAAGGRDRCRGPPVLAADESRCDFSLMVDEPFDVASSSRLSEAGPVIAVAQGSRLGPRSRVSRVSAVVTLRLWAQVG